MDGIRDGGGVAVVQWPCPTAGHGLVAPPLTPQRHLVQAQFPSLFSCVQQPPVE